MRRAVSRLRYIHAKLSASGREGMVAGQVEILRRLGPEFKSWAQSLIRATESLS